MDVEIRRIRADEGERLRDVRLRALQDAPGAFSSTFEQSRHRPRAEWDDMAANGSSGEKRAMFIAEPADGRGPFLGLAGGFSAESRPGSIELISMWVDPVTRGAGLGTRLVGAVAGWARAGECSLRGIMSSALSDLKCHSQFVQAGAVRIRLAIRGRVEPTAPV